MMKQVQCAGLNKKRVAEQTELVKNAFELVCKHAREPAEMSAKSRNGALELPSAGLRAFAERLALSVPLLCSAADTLNTGCLPRRSRQQYMTQRCHRQRPKSDHPERIHEAIDQSVGPPIRVLIAHLLRVKTVKQTSQFCNLREMRGLSR